MRKNILGKNELEAIKLNWRSAVPGLFTTRCCATGTCTDHPEKNRYKKSGKLPIIYFSSEKKDVKDVTGRYGYLRF